MAQYKVPQDVEADDKLLGPFNFRQFIYLLIVAALIALAWALAQIFPLLAILPIPPALFLLVLALPLRKDQPMETYIAALIQYYTKPNKRFWNPGQRESTIQITAPKIIEKPLTRNITEEEASHRLSFLAQVVDSEGYSLKDGFATAPVSSPVRDEFIAEAESTPDIFENYQSTQVAADLSSEADRRRAEVIQQMRAAIAANNPITIQASEEPEKPVGPTFNAANLTAPAGQAQPITSLGSPTTQEIPSENLPPEKKSSIMKPIEEIKEKPSEKPKDIPEIIPDHEGGPEYPMSRRLRELSENKDFTVATIAKEAHRHPKSHRPHKTDKNEVYISLH